MYRVLICFIDFYVNKVKYLYYSSCQIRTAHLVKKYIFIKKEIELNKMPQQQQKNQGSIFEDLFLGLFFTDSDYFSKDRHFCLINN